MKAFILKFFLINNLILITNLSFSQEIQFTYDPSGNRTSRITVSRESKSELPDSNLVFPFKKDLLKNLENLVISVSPNPTSDIINIHCNEVIVGSSLEMYLFSVKGEILQSAELNNVLQKLDLTTYPAGTYYLKIQLLDKTESWKIVKR